MVNSASDGGMNKNMRGDVPPRSMPQSKRGKELESKWTRLQGKVAAFQLVRGEKSMVFVEREVLSAFKLDVKLRNAFIKSLIEQARKKTIVKKRDTAI